VLNCRTVQPEQRAAQSLQRCNPSSVLTISAHA
jgi:hypothetical protein